MRTQEEINRQIEGLKKMKENLPETNFFGDNNWEVIDAQIDILQGGDYEDYQEADYAIEAAAYDATGWLEGDIDEDLFETE